MIIEYKGYQIKPHKQFPTSYICVTAGKGGTIPDVLGGLFTSTGLVKDLIDKYLEGKAVVNAKAISKGGV
jgi:hypothetical protein